jgi:hypothetical protein
MPRLRNVLRLIRAGRYGFYMVMCAMLMSLLTVAGIRMAPSAEWFDMVIVLGLVAGLAWGTRRWYRKARAQLSATK